MKITILSDEQQASFKAATQPVYKKWIPKIGKNLVKEAKKDMKD